jgi:hypothetical protein
VAMTNPSDRFPDNMRQHLVDAIADYVEAFKACAQSDGSDLVALLHQLVEAIAAVNRAMCVGPILVRYIECILGPPPAQPATSTEPTVEAQHRDDLARWTMEALRLLCRDFLLVQLNAHPMLDALHNDLDRALGGGAPEFIRAVGERHGNKRDVLRHAARDALVYTVILAATELDGSDRNHRVLDSAGIGISERGFTNMRQNVEDKAALDRITEEAKRRRHNRQARKDAARQASRPSRGRPATPRPEKPMAAALIAGSLTDAELLALYPERYRDLTRFGTMEERIRYLFSIWNGTGAQGPK